MMTMGLLVLLAAITLHFLCIGRPVQCNPVVTVTPATATVAAGSDQTFGCTYSSSSSNAPVLDWAFTPVGGTRVSVYQNAGGQVAIGSGYENRVTFVGDITTTDLSLQLRGLTVSDSGTYRCQVFVLGDGIEDGMAVINVKDPPGTPSLTLTPDPVREDADVQLSCSVTSGSPPFTYTFHRGSTQLATGAADTTTVSGIRRGQTSGYTCTVQNELGAGYAQTSSQEDVNVHYLDVPTLASGHSNTTLNGQTVTIVEGKRLSVQCSAVANPTASIQWSGSNVGSGAVLNKNSVTPDDDGTYTCTASSSNIVGEPKSTSVQLEVHVLYPPNGNPTCNATTSGDDVLLTCELQGGNPPVDLVWSQPAGTSQKSVNQVNAPVTAVGTTYTCTATSVALNPARTCSVTLASPSVTVSPKPTSTVQQGTVGHSLTCTVDPPGVPAASALTWMGPAVEAGRTTGGDLATPSLTISGVLKTDAGDYTCTATNLVGDDSDSLSLVVQYGPTDTVVTPAFAAEREGDPLTLTCTSDGVPAPTFTWSTPGGSANGNTVQVTSLDRSQAGNYTCTADNGIGDAESATGSVDVLYLDTPTLNQTSPLTVLEGDSVIILCSAVANPTAGYKWTKQNSSDQWNSNVLTFTQVNRSDAGTYICEASNNIKGTTETKNKTLDIIVNYAPDLNVTATPNPVNETYSVSLTCTADSHPDVTSMSLTHATSGRDIPGTLQGNVLTSTIQEVTYEDRGNYTCMATNTIGSAKTTLDLIVNFSPKFTHQEDPYTAAERNTVNLTCSAIAEPAITAMQWIRNGQVLTTGGQFTVTQRSAGVSVLTIADVMEDNYGMYNCTAENAKGLKWRIITLQAQGPPHAPTNLKVVYKNPDGHVTVQWTAGFNGGLETDHTVDFKKQGENKDWTSGDTVTQPESENHKNYNVSLQLGSQGNFTIRVRTSNSAGSATAVTVDVLIEGEAVLEGLLIVNQTFNPKYHQLDSQESQDFIKVVVAGVNETMKQADLPGYQGSTVSKLRPGSVVTDFKATVATSEVQRAIDAFDGQVATGSVGILLVHDGSSLKIYIVISNPGLPLWLIILIIILSVCVIGGFAGGTYSCRKRMSNKDKKDVELKERKPKPMGIARPYVPVPDSPTSLTPNTEDDDLEGPYATSPSVPMAGGNPYDDVHFEGDGTKAPVAGAAAGPLDPNVQYATVNKNNNETPNPSTIYAQVDKDKKKKDKEKPTLAVDPSSEYATVDKSKKKKKDMPPPPEDPSAQYSEVKKDKKKGKKEMPPTPEDPSAQYSEVKKDKKKDKKAPAPDVIYTEVVKDKKDKKEKKDKKKPTPGKKPAVAKKPTAKDEERLYDEVPKAEGAAAVTDENPYENPQESMPEKQKNPQGLIYAELSDFQVKPPPKKPSKPAPPKPRYEDEPTEYASINWNASRRRAKEREQSGSTTDDETPVTMI